MQATLKDLEQELWLRMRNQGEIKWRTRTGEEIPINYMSDVHLVRAINMCRRAARKAQEKAQEDEWKKLAYEEGLSGCPDYLLI